jgi:hypothetical protein
MVQRLTFAGLTGRSDPDALPSAYKSMVVSHGAKHAGSFERALQHLKTNYDAEWHDLYYGKLPSGEGGPAEPVEGVSKFDAVVNPEWVDEDESRLPGERTDAVWYVPTSKYTLLPHHTAFKPLSQAVDRVDADDVFGVVRTQREGAEVHLDLFFRNQPADTEGDGEITLGISTGNDYCQRVSLYVDVVAFLNTTDGEGRVMRYLVDRESRKHTGDATEDVILFFENAVRKLDDASDRVRNVVANAMHYTVAMDETEITPRRFYDALGLPDRAPNEVVTHATDRVTAIKPPGHDYTAWHLYKAGTWAIENHYEPRDTVAFKNHVTSLNTVLFNPGLAERRVLSDIETELVEAKRDDDAELAEFSDDVSTVDEKLETVRTRAKSISEGVTEFEDTRERLKALLTDDGTEEVVTDDETVETTVTPESGM